MDSWEIFQMDNIPLLEHVDAVEDKVLKQYIKEYWNENNNQVH